MRGKSHSANSRGRLGSPSSSRPSCAPETESETSHVHAHAYPKYGGCRSSGVEKAGHRTDSIAFCGRSLGRGGPWQPRGRHGYAGFSCGRNLRAERTSLCRRVGAGLAARAGDKAGIDLYLPLSGRSDDAPTLKQRSDSAFKKGRRRGGAKPITHPENPLFDCATSALLEHDAPTRRACARRPPRKGKV
jgi:hypothetical protein